MRDEYTRPSRLLNTSEGRDNSSLAVSVLRSQSHILLTTLLALIRAHFALTISFSFILGWCFSTPQLEMVELEDLNGLRTNCPLQKLQSS